MLFRSLPMVEEGEPNPEFEAILDTVDPNRDGHVSLQEYMAFMISRETENVKSSEEIESAFRALSSEGKPYVTKEELYQVWVSAFGAGGWVCPLKGKSPGKAGPELGGRAV